ncbi:GtrA family protein, partial [Stenotrophomonas maltophilia]
GTTPVVGSTLGAIFGLVLNFTVSRRWVFGAPAKVGATLSRFLLVWVLALLFNAWMLAVLFAAGLHYLVA